MALPRALILFGGPDAEHAVSLESGRGVVEGLRQLGRHEVVPLEVGRCTFEELAALRPDVVFPVLHGPWGEGGPLQDVLESLEATHGVPYVEVDRAARLAMDKLATKLLASGEGVPTPRSQELRPGDPCDVQAPLVLKPIDEGSSVDLRICRDESEVARARLELEARRPRLMAERYIEGAEITVGIVNGETLPLIEIRPASGVYDYEAKYHRDDTTYLLDPPLKPGLTDLLRRFARTVFDRLGCRDLARVDFMVDTEGPWLLEVNTMPGFTSHSLVPMAARHAGIPMPELCGRLVDRALARSRRRPEGAPATGTPRHGAQ